jgi:hypothetical protein
MMLEIISDNLLGEAIQYQIQRILSLLEMIYLMNMRVQNTHIN